MKKNPIGVDDFKVLVTECYYVDKTRLIEEIINKGSQKIYLFNRPRRFGKSAIISMLYNFFANREDNKHLFNDLYIGKTEYFKYCNGYPTIYINNKDFEVDTFEEMVDRFAYLISKLYLEHQYLLESHLLAEVEKEDFKNIINRKANNTILESALLNLSHYLNRYYNSKVVVLIDEYDSPLTSSYEYGFFDKASRFFKSVYSQLLKGNYSIYFAVLTGVLKVSKINLFSGLNNLMVDNGITTYFDEYFGFTYRETKELLEYFNAGSYYDQIIDWYGGYNFAKKVTNPWSTLSFLFADNVIKLYWSKTSSNDLLDLFYNHINQSDALNFFSSLINDEKINIQIDENYNYEDMDDINTLSNFLVSTGYLSCESTKLDSAFVYIPNLEIKELFKVEVFNRFKKATKIENSLISDLKYNLIHQNDDKVANNISDVLKSVISYYEFNREEDYQIFMGTLSALLFNECNVQREMPSGDGRCDILITPKKGYNFGAIIEIKHLSNRISIDRLKNTAEAALNQIIKRNYLDNPLLKNVPNIYIYGVAFYKKNVKVVSKKIK